MNKKIKISQKIVDFAKSLKNLNSSENKNDFKLKKIFLEKANFLNEENKMIIDDEFNSDKKRNIELSADEVNKIEYTIENNHRGQLLRNCADTVKKQNQIFFKHVFYLQEIDKMLEKLEKCKNKNSSEIN